MTEIRRSFDLLSSATIGLLVVAFMIGALHPSPTYAETKTVVGQGSTDTCHSRESALELARINASNDARDECHALGGGWSFTGMKFAGYEQCQACGGKEFRCKVTQAMFVCTNMQKERAEKAAKERAEKEAKNIEAKDRADREHAKKVAKANVAKDKGDLEKREQTAKKEEPKKSPTDKNASIEKSKGTNGNDPPLSLGASALDGTSSTGSVQTKEVRSQKKLEKSEKSDMLYSDALDKVTDRPAVQRKHAQLVDAFRNDAKGACDKEIALVQACLRKSCPDANGPSEAACKSLPNRPARMLGAILTSTPTGPCNERCQREREEWREESRRKSEREDEAFAELEAAWKSRWGELASQCEKNKQSRAAQNQCFQAAEHQCNPTGLSAQSCLDRRMVHAPTEAAAQAVHARETGERMRADQRPKFLD